MQETLRPFRPEFVAYQATCHNPYGVGQDGDWHHQDNQSGTYPDPSFGKVRISDPKGDQGQERTNTAACLSDFYFVKRHLKKISFAEYRYTGQRNEVLGRSGRQQLQGESDLALKEAG